jgi:cytochrome P450
MVRPAHEVTEPISLEAARRMLSDSSAFTDESTLHQALALLRREDPIPYIQAPGFRPVYALTRHADVYEAELHPKEFNNAPHPVYQDIERNRLQKEVGGIRTLIHMDDPDHKDYRAVTADWFRPSVMARLQQRLDDLARESVDRMAALGGECDFATAIAKPYPLQVILALLGLPESDYDRMFQLTQMMFAADDTEITGAEASDTAASVADSISGFFEYFAQLSARRKADPTTDLASVVANATIHGAPMPALEQMSYYTMIATAGHDTTSAAIAGGLQALIEHPDQLERLQGDLSLLPTAADEIIRWVTPIKHFMRTLTTPYDLGGHHFEPGDAVIMSYLSANFDESVFEDPFAFDVSRSPNPHLSFGFGVHYCMGAKLAKMEIVSILGELLPRLRSIELAGPPELIPTLFIGGLKHLPIRYVLR